MSEGSSQTNASARASTSAGTPPPSRMAWYAESRGTGPTATRGAVIYRNLAGAGERATARGTNARGTACLAPGAHRGVPVSRRDGSIEQRDDGEADPQPVLSHGVDRGRRGAEREHLDREHASHREPYPGPGRGEQAPDDRRRERSTRAQQHPGRHAGAGLHPPPGQRREHHELQQEGQCLVGTVQRTRQRARPHGDIITGAYHQMHTICLRGLSTGLSAVSVDGARYGGLPMDVPDLVPLLYRADWTGLSLSADVTTMTDRAFSSRRRSRPIAPGSWRLIGPGSGRRRKRSRRSRRRTAQLSRPNRRCGNAKLQPPAVSAAFRAASWAFDGKRRRC